MQGRAGQGAAEPGGARIATSPDWGDEALARFLLELRSRGVSTPALLNAFEAVPRAPFMPDARPGLLYAPIALPLPCGEDAIDPFTLARMLMLLAPQPGAAVLEIGSGSGFASAVMARLGMQVETLERYATLVRRAEHAFKLTACTGITIRQADGLARGATTRRVSRMIIQGALAHIPQSLFEPLEIGGIAVGARLREGRAILSRWMKTADGALESEEFGQLRLGSLREGLPKTL